MYFFLLTVLVLDGVFLGIVILLQSGKGGGLAAMGGGAAAGDILGGKRATTVLIRATWISGGLFMALSLVLAIMSSRAQQPQSVLQQDVQQSAPAPEPLLPGATQEGGEARGVLPSGGAGGGADSAGGGGTGG